MSRVATVWRGECAGSWMPAVQVPILLVERTDRCAPVREIHTGRT
jgi:hypothetical protein